jgi:CxxC motif-containing protein (DUF1111 family)
VQRKLKLVISTSGTFFLLGLLSIGAFSEELPAFNPLDDDDLSDQMAGGPFGALYVGSDGFSVSYRNLTKEAKKTFVVGKSTFNQNWVTFPASVKSLQGLGPLFNAQSCSTCHAKDGRGRPPLNDTESMSSMLVRLSLPGKAENGGVVPHPEYGDQLHPHAIQKVKPAGEAKVTYQERKGSYPDGTEFTLIEPKYSFVNLSYGEFPKEMMFSPRVAPQTYGLGLLEAVSEKDILSRERPEKEDSISGRANWVWDFSKKKTVLGRFGWKANQPSLAQQDAGAFLGDMGITSPLFPSQNCGKSASDCKGAPHSKTPEADKKTLADLESYMRLVAPPARRNLKDPKILAGGKLFKSVSCQSCHTPTLRTGDFPEEPALSRINFHPYTDLLLHDMGKDLADGRPDFMANGNEWRTPPLWGIGLIPKVNDHSRLLHDGRARNIEEAILWHGGEAKASREAFMNLSADDRKKLIQFVEAI